MERVRDRANLSLAEDKVATDVAELGVHCSFILLGRRPLPGAGALLLSQELVPLRYIPLDWHVIVLRVFLNDHHGAIVSQPHFSALLCAALLLLLLFFLN